MSEVVTLTTGASATIYGTLANATAYISLMTGDVYTAWRALTLPDDQKRTLVTATRYLDRRTWNADTAGSFATRDAIPAFQSACYELAAIAASDPGVLSALETGSNIKTAGAGSAHVEFFRPTSVAAGTSSPLPDIVQQLVGSYLGSGSITVIGGYGQSGNCESGFDDANEFTLTGPR